MNTALLNNQIASQFLNDVSQGTRVQAEYVWIGGSGTDLRSKTKTLEKKPKSVDELPEWNYDGSSTNQAPGEDSEVILKPRAIFPDPFRRGDNILVMCDCYKPDGTPIDGNNRVHAQKVFDNEKVKAEKPWYGIEQEYTMFHADKTPLGWPKNGYPAPQGPYYCSAGAQNAFGREVVEVHYRACLYAGITISGVNAEVMAGQWEYQVGPVEGIAAGDQLWISRYLLERVGEMFGVIISLDPKPIPGDWNGAGCHTNYSTETMRKDGGIKAIMECIERLGKKHPEHMAAYGEGNERRMTGRHETASFDKFSYGVANRGASIRIPRTTEADGKGYLEDRRPSSNMDPYVVCSIIASTNFDL